MALGLFAASWFHFKTVLDSLRTHFLGLSRCFNSNVSMTQLCQHKNRTTNNETTDCSLWQESYQQKILNSLSLPNLT
jgi:hypothetical protein